MNNDTLEGSTVDAVMQDLFEAYKETVLLCGTKSATDARKRAKRVKLYMEKSVGKLAQYGIHAEDQWNSLLKR